MISDNLVTAHAHNVIILYGATVNINPVSAPASNDYIAMEQVVGKHKT